MSLAANAKADLATLGPLLRSNLEVNGVTILPPQDVADTLEMLVALGIHAQALILDPWYNKGIGSHAENKNGKPSIRNGNHRTKRQPGLFDD